MPDENQPPKGTDYSNAKRHKESKGKDQSEKKITAVVKSSEVKVIEKKRGIGAKIRDLFVAADFKTVMHYVAYDVLIPAARNMIVDSATKGVERMMYGERPRRGIGAGSRYSYHTPVNRERGDYRDARTRPPDPVRVPRRGRSDFLLQTREDATIVVDEMYNLLSEFDAVSVADLKELVGFPISHVDNKWGWTDLSGTDIRQVRDGYLIDLPPEEAL